MRLIVTVVRIQVTPWRAGDTELGIEVKLAFVRSQILFMNHQWRRRVYYVWALIGCCIFALILRNTKACVYGCEVYQSNSPRRKEGCGACDWQNHAFRIR